VATEAFKLPLASFFASKQRSPTSSRTQCIRSRPPAGESPIDEVGLAFEVLGLAPSAAHEEVKARFRALAKEWHPDRFTNDDPKSAEADMRMSQINVAYSVICEARGW
jgi:DnaJ-class molecular chaperone